MKRFWITGSSGSGKTTLARQVSRRTGIPITHRDQITWMAGWQERPAEDQARLIKEMADQDQWIFDSNMFSASRTDGRMDKCDVFVHVTVNRWVCLWRALRRYWKHRKSSRPDLPEGCEEDIDWVLIRYILFEYPARKRAQKREAFFEELRQRGKRVYVLQSASDTEKFLKDLD